MQQKVHLHSIEGLVRISAVLGEAIADLSSRVSELEQRLDWSAIEAFLCNSRGLRSLCGLQRLKRSRLPGSALCPGRGLIAGT